MRMKSPARSHRHVYSQSKTLFQLPSRLTLKLVFLFDRGRWMLTLKTLASFNSRQTQTLRPSFQTKNVLRRVNRETTFHLISIWQITLQSRNKLLNITLPRDSSLRNCKNNDLRRKIAFGKPRSRLANSINISYFKKIRQSTLLCTNAASCKNS